MLSSTNEIAAYFGGTYAEALAGTKAGMTIIFHNGKLKAKDAEITGIINATDGTFSGKLNGVTGTFKVLQAIDNNGNVKASINFDGNDGCLSFTGDMMHGGYDYNEKRGYIFRTADMWVRGVFGCSAHTVLVVHGTYGYLYTNGLGSATEQTNHRQYVSFATGTDSSKRTYYKLPLYGTNGKSTGMPVDVVCFLATDATRNYQLVELTKGKITTLVNAQKSKNQNVYIHGSLTGLATGTMQQCIYLGAEFMNPVQATNVLGAGLILGGTLVNNWS